MAIEKVDHNLISTNYSPDERGRFGFDSLNINIQNTSFGALQMLRADLQELATTWRERDKECWHPVSSAYAGLLEKLCNDLKTKF